MTIAIGDKIPAVTFKEKLEDGMAEVSSDDVFSGKKIVLFAVPGAFTPTCHLSHLPGFLEHREEILSKGVDDIVVVSVNDAFVMGAWAASTQGQGKIRYLSDWDASYTKAVGMDMDLSAGTLGVRSSRYAMIVEDGVVTVLNSGDNPGEAVASSAVKILEAL